MHVSVTHVVGQHLYFSHARVMLRFVEFIILIFGDFPDSAWVAPPASAVTTVRKNNRIPHEAGWGCGTGVAPQPRLGQLLLRVAVVGVPDLRQGGVVEIVSGHLSGDHPFHVGELVAVGNQQLQVLPGGYGPAPAGAPA